MYARPSDGADVGPAVNLWGGGPASEVRATPTLMTFMKDNIAILRQTQQEVASLMLSPDSRISNFLRRAFPDLEGPKIFGGLQQLSLEICGDLYLRFSCEYNRFPFRLIQLLDASLAQEEKRRIAWEAHATPQLLHAISLRPRAEENVS